MRFLKKNSTTRIYHHPQQQRTTTYTAAAVVGRVMNVVQVVFGKMVSVRHCSKCSSVQGKGLLNKKCADCAEKLSEARAALTAARRLERDFSERVTNPLRMAKTGEVYIRVMISLCVVCSAIVVGLT